MPLVELLIIISTKIYIRCILSNNSTKFEVMAGVRLLLASNFCLDMPLPEYAANARLCRRQESLACLKAF